MKSNMAAAAILNSEKLKPLLYYKINAHQIWWECSESDMDCTLSSRNANSPKVTMAAAVSLNFENLLPFLH